MITIIIIIINIIRHRTPIVIAPYTEYLVKATYCDKTPSPVCDFKPSGDQHSEAFHRSGVQETKGDCAPLDRSLVTLMAQESLIETIGAKRTLEIANIRRQLSCWYADRKIFLKNKKWERKERERKSKSFQVWSSALWFDRTNLFENLPLRNPENMNMFSPTANK